MLEMSDPLARRADRLDAWLWFLLPALALLAIPIGFVSNDGLGHARSLAAGAWRLNPNHLLYEPLGAWWLDVLSRLGSTRLPVDQLKLLSAFTGALAAGLFRLGIAPRLTESRRAANVGTAWLALSSAFLRLWVSDEFHMIQMPAVVAVAWAALRAVERPGLRRALALGAAVALSALAFVSNLVVGAALAAVLVARHVVRREWRRAFASAGGIGLGAALVALPPLLAAWSRAAGVDFFAWLASYGGAGQQLPRSGQAYGLVYSAAGFAEAAARAAYGAASALVDLTPIVAALRDREIPMLPEVAGALAFLAAASALAYAAGIAWRDLRRGADHGPLLLVLAWLAGVLGFGFFWNNSDDQFYLQLAPIFGVLGAVLARAADHPPTRRGRRPAATFLVLGFAGLFWNLLDVTCRRILYPRQERMALLGAEVAGSCLVVMPGFDEAELLLRLLHPGSPRVSTLTDLATIAPADHGLPALIADLERCLAAGERVVLIDVFDMPLDRAPWKFLRRLGYDHAQVEAALARLPIDRVSRTVGPFRVREAGR